MDVSANRRDADEAPGEALERHLPRLDEDAATDAGVCGSKAAALASLKRAGFEVPDGFVLPCELDLDRVGDDALREAVEALGGFPVAVRSSGVLEDLDAASFAGQYETCLDVGDVAELRDAVRTCRRSADNERVRSYLASRGADEARAGVAVLVQRMVEAAVAGVAFTLHPMTGREEHALVELVSGLGERLVAGRAAPTSATLSLDDAGVVEQTVGSDGVALEPDAAATLRERLLAVQAHFGRPQDVEWALDGEGRLHVLQSRPITRVQWRTDVDELTNADFREGGVSARVCTPLMYDLYRRATQASLQRYMEDLRLLPRGRPERWIALHYGRPYWNASAVKRAMAKVPGFDEAQFDRGLGLRKDYGEAGPHRTGWTPRTLLRALPVLRALHAEYRAQLERVRGFREPFMAAHDRWRERIEAFSDTPDAELFRDLAELVAFQGDTEQAYFRTVADNSNAQSELQDLVARMDRATGRETALPRLLGGLAGVHHMAMQEDLTELVRLARRHGTDGEAWRKALSSFLARHGFHADVELDLTVPRWESAPERVRERVESMLAAGAEPADPRAAQERQQAEYDEELRAVREALRSSWSARLRFARAFERKLARARAFLAAREEMREYSARCYALVRRYVVEAGRRLAARGTLREADEVFMLTTGELVALGRGTRDPDELAETIRLRRLFYEGYRHFPAPGEFGRGVTELSSGATARSEAGGRVLEGVGCSPGVTTGRVRVAGSLDETRFLERGEILVTRFTDPGWTPVFGLVAGVVTEVGGLLSHAAVIGREYGVPAVLNVPGATTQLETGDRVRIDGNRGSVEVLDEEPS